MIKKYYKMLMSCVLFISIMLLTTCLAFKSFAKEVNQYGGIGRAIKFSENNNSYEVVPFDVLD